MDIGGGSIEFTLTHHDQINFQASLPIGLGVIHSKFPLSDPVLNTEISALIHFLDQEGEELKTAAKNYPPSHLIGCSGTFDVLANVLTPAYGIDRK